MTKMIQWETRIDQVLDRAKAEHKVVFLEIYNPDRIARKQMDTDEEPNASAIDFINQNAVPLRISSVEQPTEINFAISWTPALHILDPNGQEYYRSIGFCEAAKLVPAILLSIGKIHFDRNEFVEAINVFKKIVAEYPESDLAPEAIFLAGVCFYNNTNDPMFLLEAYNHLLKEYPQSPWSKKALWYRLLYRAGLTATYQNQGGSHDPKNANL